MAKEQNESRIVKKYLFYIQSMIGGGAERVMSILINTYANEGVEVCLATNTSLPFAYEIDSRVHIIDMYKSDIPVTRSPFNKIKRHLWKYCNIRTIAKEVAPDVVISFVTALNNDVILALLGTHIPVIVSEHTNVKRSIPSKTKVLRRLLYPFANAITVLTRHDYKIWRSKYRNVVYMPNPCDKSESIVPFEERNKTVLAVGRVNIWHIKGFDILLKSWGIICEKHKDWQLQIAGTTDEKSLAVLEQIASDSCCTNYSFLGFRRDIKELMAKSSVFVLSSRTEGLPMVLIESMGAGCCCVATDCVTGPNEIIRNSVSGLLTEEGNVVDLAEKLDKVISNKQLRESLSKQGPKSIEKYSIKRVMGRWRILLNKISC